MELQMKKLCRFVRPQKIKRKVDDSDNAEAILHHIRKTNDSLKFFEPKTFKYSTFFVQSTHLVLMENRFCFLLNGAKS
jgi:hypothetical protein